MENETIKLAKSRRAKKGYFFEFKSAVTVETEKAVRFGKAFGGWFPKSSLIEGTVDGQDVFLISAKDFKYFKDMLWSEKRASKYTEFKSEKRFGAVGAKDEGYCHLLDSMRRGKDIKAPNKFKLTSVN